MSNILKLMAKNIAELKNLVPNKPKAFKILQGIILGTSKKI